MMNMRLNKYAQMQSKLEEGLQVLEDATAEDSQLILNAALIKLHGAMEDFVRLEVGQKAPHLRETVEDARLTAWKDLLEHGRTYLGFTDEDCRIISEANTQRQKVAHGGNYEKKLSDLKRYARFVQKWCKRASGGDDWGQDQIIEMHPPPQSKPAAPPVYHPPVRERAWDARPGTYSKPWYRSTLFLFLIFFLLPPLWALLILTDRSQGCLPRSFAALILSVLMFVCAYLFLPLPSIYSNAVRDVWQMFNASPSPTQVLATIPTPPSVNASPLASHTDSVTNDSSTCEIVWVEQSSDKLTGKNRSMVWTEIVQEKVEGSGMTSSQFYQFVVDHNPHLVTDGYEFKAGKSYYLPECKR
jgi:hypothetical protein